MRRLVALLLSVMIQFVGSHTNPQINQQEAAVNHDIVILFTNDIHGGIDSGVTLAGVAAYKERMEAVCPNVALVDCGDAVQGSYLGTLSRGEVLVDAMNCVGYDYCTLGNHEFGYGIQRLNELIAKADARYLCCNLTYSGTEGGGLENVEPYAIETYGDTKVAFVGIATPETLNSANPKTFLENDTRVYDFSGGNNGETICDTVQKTVDEARQAGADYVICLSHLGISEDEAPYLSTTLAENTTGIDAILDGHSHTQFAYFNTENAEGEPVVIAQTGTELAALGQLVITGDGIITASMVSDITEKDPEADAEICALEEKYNELLEAVAFTNTVELSVTDENGIRAVRNRETAIGNMTSDALRIESGADIAYVNGGSIRATVPAGDVKVSDAIAVFPFADTVYKLSVTGAEIADMLEFFTMNAKPEVADSAQGIALGEDGSFPQMSGLTFTLDTTIEPDGIEVSEEGNLISVSSAKRRVSNIKVLQDGKYVPVDPEKTYSMAAFGYVAVKGGCGMLTFLADHETESVGILDYDCLLQYMTDTLGGDLSRYSTPEGRIRMIR